MNKVQGMGQVHGMEEKALECPQRVPKESEAHRQHVSSPSGAHPWAESHLPRMDCADIISVYSGLWHSLQLAV